MNNESTLLQELVAALQERSGLSGRAFARRLKIGHSTVLRWQQGKPIGNTGRAALRAYLGVPESKLKGYLAGKVDLAGILPPIEFLSRSPEVRGVLEDFDQGAISPTDAVALAKRAIDYLANQEWLDRD